MTMMLTLSEFKVVFNQKAILDPADRARNKLLKEVGAYTRTVAKNSMIDMAVAKGNAKKLKSRDRKIKRAGFKVGADGSQVSKPGNPAFSRVGWVKQHIYFAVDKDAKNVVIGPAKLNGTKSQHAIEVLEYGGIEQIFLGGPKRRISVTAKYEPRPTMRLALAKTIQKKLPALIAGGIMREA